MTSERFEFACWTLTEKGDSKLLERELKRLLETRTGQQIVQAEELLGRRPADPAPTAD